MKNNGVNKQRSFLVPSSSSECLSVSKLWQGARCRIFWDRPVEGIWARTSVEASVSTATLERWGSAACVSQKPTVNVDH